MTQLNYSVTGEGEPLLILHGLFGSSKNWQSHARGFARYFRTIAVDLRNHGQSFQTDTMNYELMAQDVSQLQDHLGLSKCRLLGHSMGGKVAMTLAIQRPELISHLVIADIAPVKYEHHFDDLINPVLALPLELIASRTDADQFLQATIQEGPLRAFLLQNLVREADVWQWRVNWAVIQREMEAITGFDPHQENWLIEIPTLFIRGAKSDYIGDAEIAEINLRFSDVKVETLANAGHWLHAEQPRAFFNAVIDYLTLSQIRQAPEDSRS